MPPADGDFAVHVSRGQGEFGRGLGHHFHNEFPVHTDDVAVNLAARLAQDVQRFVVQPLHADFFKDTHRTIMNRSDALGTQRLDRRVNVDRRVPRHLFDHSAAAARSSPRAAPAACLTFCVGAGHHISLRCVQAFKTQQPARGDIAVCDDACRFFQGSRDCTA